MLSGALQHCSKCPEKSRVHFSGFRLNDQSICTESERCSRIPHVSMVLAVTITTLIYSRSLIDGIALCIFMCALKKDHGVLKQRFMNITINGCLTQLCLVQHMAAYTSF